MKINIKKSIHSLALAVVLAFGVGMVAPALHADSASAACETTSGIVNGLDCANGDREKTDLFGGSGIFTKVVNVLLFIIGAVAVIMLIYGGFKYVVSGGDANAVTSAKNTILYAVIGIIVALLAFAILNFVVGSFGGSGGAGGADPRIP